MNTNETVLVQIVAIKYVGGHKRGTIYRGVIVLAAFQPAVIWDLVRFYGIMSYKLRPQDLYSALKA